MKTIVELIWALQNLTPTAIIDILIVALFFFAISFFIRGTQAVALLRGILLLIAAVALVSNSLQLLALRWLLENLLTVLAIAIPIIFQPEIRRLLERLGQGTLFVRTQAPEVVRLRIIEDICQAAERLAERRHGALVVLERNSSLQEYIRTGITVNAEVSPQLLLTIFSPKTELHDGAVIIDRAGRIAAAAAVLPLSSVRNMQAPKLGTRHRAALGLSETSDAIVVVISEETGRISIAQNGRLIAKLDGKRLRTILNAFYGLDRRPEDALSRRVRETLSSVLNRRQRRERS
ncbi:MAG: diadenylate cyclase CdaA [Chloroflexota bacterium]|nr:diadenylate cyclase CdaA [Chloroflexota bacterium]